MQFSNPLYVLMMILIFGVGNSYGQASFLDEYTKRISGSAMHSTIAMASDDLNRDGSDDLIILHNGRLVYTYTQQGDRTKYEGVFHQNVSLNGEWALMTGDLDNDGIPEILSSGVDDGADVMFRGDSLYATSYNTKDVYSQNTNLVDLNGDGFLDFFVCNDIGENVIYINNGEGQLYEETLIDFQTSPEDDMSGNYSSMFSDIDGDGDQDLYIGKCRAGVEDPSDPRRINTLYINNGDGTYTEDGNNRGVALGAQSWSVDFGDVDNDGDLDLYVAHHDAPHQLLLNDGHGYFSEYDYLQDPITSFAFQSYFADFDNNGWLDIFVTEPSKSYIIYNDEMSFTPVPFEFENNKPFTGITGDFNDDGHLDMYLGFSYSFIEPNDIPDGLMINEGNNNNHLRVTLEGINSNRDAIGAKIIIYHEGKLQIREVTAGKSYGIQGSTTQHFGLADHEFIDSIKVIWPNGSSHVFFDIPNINAQLFISQNGCISERVRYEDVILCEGKSHFITIPDQYQNVKWSDGAIGNERVIDKTGDYAFTFTMNGCFGSSYFFNVTKEDLSSQDIIIGNTEEVACVGDVLLTAVDAESYLWSNGETTPSIIAEHGANRVTVTTSCATYVSDIVLVNYIEHYEPEIDIQVENDEYNISTGLIFPFVKWFSKENGELLSENKILTLPKTDDTLKVDLEVTSFDFKRYDQVAPIIPLVDVGDTIYNKNDTVAFNVLSPIFLQKFMVRTTKSGSRKLLLLDEDMNQINSFEQYFTNGLNYINLFLHLEVGRYHFTFDPDASDLDGESPMFSISDLLTMEDKSIDGVIEIENGTLYSDITPYFFKWEVYSGRVDCPKRYPLLIYDGDLVSTGDVHSTLFSIYPNPTTNMFSISSENEFTSIEIRNIQGELIDKKNVSNGISKCDIDIEHIPPGVYLISVLFNQGRKTNKLVIH